MSIELMIRAHSAEDLKNQLSDLLGGLSQVGATAPQPSPPEASARRAKPKAETQATATSPEPSDTSQTTQTEAPTTDDAGGATSASPSEDIPATLTYDADIKPAVLKVSAKHGRPGVENLLASFDVGNAKEVPEAKWPELLAEIDKLLAD